MAVLSGAVGLRMSRILELSWCEKLRGICGLTFPPTGVLQATQCPELDKAKHRPSTDMICSLDFDENKIKENLL